MTPPETEVVSCPACNHLLRVPLDLLGQPVQCPECRAMFRAPAPDGTGGMAAAELLSRPPGAAAPGRRADAALLLPAFGLMFCGVAGVGTNGYLAYLFAAEPGVAAEYVRDQFSKARGYGFGADDPEGERDRLDGERAVATARWMRWYFPPAAGAALLAFLGGLSIALGWNYRLAQVGCVTAGLNLTGCCCVPGAAAGLWGLLMLRSGEGRAHFGRSTPV
ncbi:MAG: hypothetical protein C0501_09395 [Isosphaera sp.]|nr:hypothetical protein [Isosphaera sp.]